ncbi:MAG: helix-turn-helix domain-containing protein [Candidatus Omnitrophica bacterium]|nr:helix-turn-helix domain-containing protein [Candidatus Omnitrophota bacterium]
MEKLWTTSEVAQFLGVAEVDVEELVRQGKLTGYKLGGRFLRFRPDQVEALKGQVAFRPYVGKPLARGAGAWRHRAQEFLYFYDFYLVSAGFLAVLVIYLIAAG